MELKYFDIHSHLHFPDYDNDRGEEIKKIKEGGIGTIVIGTDYQTSKEAIKLAEENEYFFASVGEHPGYIDINSIFNTDIKKLAKRERVVAIGECGFDYFRLNENAEKIKKVQEKIFTEQIELSLEEDKPLMLHIRQSKNSLDAYIDALNILESVYKNEGNKLRGNVHFFSGDMDILKRILDIGFFVSFTGVITFSTDYNEFIKYAPIERIMSETDAPFLAPIPHRGKRNSPLFIKEVVKKISEIRSENFEDVSKQLLQNAINFFGIKSD